MLINPRETNHVLSYVRQERSNQDDKWQTQDHTPLEWLGILAEEFGEVAQETVGYQFSAGAHTLDQLREELIHVAAVAACAIESIERQFDYTCGLGWDDRPLTMTERASITGEIGS